MNHDTPDQAPDNQHHTPAPRTQNNSFEQPGANHHGDVQHQTNSHSQYAASSITQQHHPVVTTQQPQATTEVKKSSPGLLVLQWLTYAFWGWTLLAIGVLTGLVMNSVFGGESSSFSTGIAYALAATIVLHIISLITDIVYSRREPIEKRGGSMVIMIIHAVLYALFGIGWMIFGVFGLVGLLIGSGDFSSDNPAVVSIATASVMVILYALELLRIMRPRRWSKLVPLVFWVVTTVTALIVIIAGVVGPASQARLLQADKQLEQALPAIARSVNDYAQANEQLPDSLNDIKDDLDSEVQQVIEDNKVEYNMKGMRSEMSPLQGVIDGSDSSDMPLSPIYRYQLCTTYAAESDYYDEDRYDDYPSSTNEYDVSPSTYSHPAGRVCYDLQTDYSYRQY